jgi:hypothetical protein
MLRLCAGVSGEGCEVCEERAQPDRVIAAPMDELEFRNAPIGLEVMTTGAAGTGANRRALDNFTRLKDGWKRQ